MQSDETILSPIPSQRQPLPTPQRKKHFPIRLFSLAVLITVLIGAWSWMEHYSLIAHGRAFGELTREDLLDALQYDNGLGVEEIALKYKFYRIFFAAYADPNILITLSILLTFPYVLNFIEKENATPIALFQLNMSSIYLQLWRLGLDLVHYFLTSKCICLASGAGAVWIHLLTKITCYNANTLLHSPLRLLTTVVAFLTACVMIVTKDRLDLLIAIVMALVDVAFMEGGTVKYPKEVFQEKEDWASAIRLNRLSLWENFQWNEYKPNERLCVDSIQFYITRQDRMILIN